MTCSVLIAFSLVTFFAEEQLPNSSLGVMPPSCAFASLIPALHNEASNVTVTAEVPGASAAVQMQPNLPLAVQPTVPIAVPLPAMNLSIR